MKSIGISLTATEVFISIGSCQQNKFSADRNERIRVPAALRVTDRLRYIRTLLLDFIALYHIELACVRIAGKYAAQASVQRVELEGIVQELLSSSSIKHYFIGTPTEIAQIAGLDVGNVPDYLSGKRDLTAILDWHLPKRREEREALMAAYAIQYSYQQSMIF